MENLAPGTSELSVPDVTMSEEIDLDIQHGAGQGHQRSRKRGAEDDTQRGGKWTRGNTGEGVLGRETFPPPVEEFPVAGTLLPNLHDLILTEGLWWMGFNVETPWEEEKGRKEFQFIWDILLIYKPILGGTLKKELYREKNARFFSHAAVYAFRPLMEFLQCFFEEEEFGEFLLPSSADAPPEEGRNMAHAWASIGRRCGGEGALKAWEYLKGKLGTEERRKEFLLRRDLYHRNALSGACFNTNPYTILSVWALYRDELDDDATCKELFHDTLSFAKEVPIFSQGALLNWVVGLLKGGFIEEGEVSHLLLDTNSLGSHYMLRFEPPFPSPPPAFSSLQTLLSSPAFPSAELLPHLRSQYMILSPSCLTSADWIGFDPDFESGVEEEFAEMLPELLSYPPFSGMPSEERGGLPRLRNWDIVKKERVRVEGIQLKAFAVLLRRLLDLEEKYLGKKEVVCRLKQGFYWMFHYLAQMFTDYGEGDWTRAYLVDLTFAVLSRTLDKDEVREILMGRDGYSLGSVFHRTFIERDPRAFLSLYDAARWSMGEAALAEVHTIEGNKKEVDTRFAQITYDEILGSTMLELLQKATEKGLFEYLHCTNLHQAHS